MDSRIQNRILYLDYARSIVLFLVVFAHLYTHDSSVKLYVYAFHMPFFFLVSGIVRKDEEYLFAFVKDRNVWWLQWFINLDI